MKTLDDVIEELNRIVQNPTEGDYENEGYYLALDTLHYLKEYRNMKKNKKYAYKKGYEDGKAEQKENDAVARRWEEDFRKSQMPWNNYTEMGG